MRYKDVMWLREQYWEKELSLSQIAEKCGVAWNTILYWMKKLEIPTRTHSENRKMAWERGCYEEGDKE